ncbi:MAG TPA: response regulator [Gemmatimonadales bacterium]|nr:response regulator [Gemmatimonadales bacterium]
MSSPTTVLVIDDEASIRRLIQRMLEPNLCQVVEAEDAEAGLRLIQRADPPIDVVLTDWIMSGLHGLDVVEVLHRHCPRLPVAVISAYTSTIHPIVRKGESLRILQKPFTGPDLQRAVQEMIGRALRQRTSARAYKGATVDLVNAAWELHHARAGRP